MKNKIEVNITIVPEEGAVDCQSYVYRFKNQKDCKRFHDNILSMIRAEYIVGEYDK